MIHYDAFIEYYTAVTIKNPEDQDKQILKTVLGTNKISGLADDTV